MHRPPIASRLSQPRSERSVSRSPSPPPQKRKKRSSGEVKKSKAVEEDEELDDKPMLGGRRIIVARPRSLSPESAASSPENLQVITSNMKKGMKKSLSSRLGPVDPSVQQQFSEKEIYEEMLRQQERRRIAIEEKEIKKLKKAMKKKERLERKLKKHDKKESRKKSKKVLDDDSDFSEGDMLVSNLLELFVLCPLFVIDLNFLDVILLAGLPRPFKGETRAIGAGSC